MPSGTRLAIVIGMKRIAKASAMELVAAVLREEIRAGRWDERLPGARVLANRLGVSPPTAAAALASLAAEGLLTGGGARRAYRVAGPHAVAPALAVAPKRLLILSHEKMEDVGDLARSLLGKIRDEMILKGWVVDYQVVDYAYVKRPQRAWDRLIRVEPGTSVVALLGRPALAEWAVRRKIPLLFLGGVRSELPVPMVAVKSATMAELALARLTALGHRRIAIPLCDHPEPFKASIREATRQALAAVGQTYVGSYHNPETAYLMPDVIWRIMESLFAKEAPTALLFLDWKELVTAHCFLAHRGLRVPDDVSIVLLNDQAEAGWFFPELTRFRFPVRRIVKTIVGWLTAGAGAELLDSLSADFIDGATVVPPVVRRCGP